MNYALSLLKEIIKKKNWYGIWEKQIFASVL